MSRLALYAPVVAALMLSACSAPQSGGINDPFEETNRRWHDTNVALDRALVGPVGKAYGVVPDDLRQGVSNMSDTLSLPGMVINDVLQLRFGDALHNSARFVVNATMGIGGFFDPASSAGLPERESDFGETLARWGVGEGAYVVLPVMGPSTERDALGLVVDVMLDPLGPLLDPSQTRVRSVLKVGELADDRARYSDLYESVLYESADSYAQMRLTYLDNRRFTLGQGATQTTGEDTSGAAYDIYEDFYE